MIKNNNLNKFFKKIILKKKYIKSLKVFYTYNLKILKFHTNNTTITYIIQICFSKSNTLIKITNCTGTLKLQYSAGSFNYRGKNKKIRVLVLNVLIKKTIQKFQFLKHKSFALHLKNVKFLKSSILKKLKKRMTVKIIKNFNNFCYNGCRNKKLYTKRNG